MEVTPVTVANLTGVTLLVSGAAHVCGVKTNGTVQCWGANSSGQLGDGAAGSFQYLPQTVPGLTGVTQLAAGAAHSCALASDGVLHCWGANSSGQLGSGTTSPYELVPTPVSW